MKICKKCSCDKDLSCFYAYKPNICKQCIKNDQLKWREKNKNYLSEWHKKNYEQNKEEFLVYSRSYYLNNKDKRNQYVKEKYRSDIQFKLASNLRRRIGKIVRGSVKSGSAIKDLGCSLDYFKQHLESKFQPGMSWSNYGEWHIDHIIPLSSFDLSDKESFIKACHYTNLQPLWAEDNLKKSDKVA